MEKLIEVSITQGYNTQEEVVQFLILDTYKPTVRTVFEIDSWDKVVDKINDFFFERGSQK